MSLLSKLFKPNFRQKPESQPAQSPEIQLDQVLIDRYQLLELVGSGAMGSVYRAQDQLLGEVIVAVKFLARSLQDAAIAARFAREAKIGALLGHQSIHIVRVLDYGLHREHIPFYVMEYLRGQTLEELISLQPISWQQLTPLMIQICAGLASAHQGITLQGQRQQVIHRDLKPSNIFISNDASLGQFAKLLDFGIADILSHSDPSTNSRQTDSLTSVFTGTVAYGSPEQFIGESIDQRSDIYSLGVTMFEALTGLLPIMAEANTLKSWSQAHQHLLPQPLQAVDPNLEVPAPLADLIMSCLAKSPEQRPQTATEIGNCLKDLGQSLSSPYIIAPSGLLPTTVSIHSDLPRSDHSPTVAEQTQFLQWSQEDLAWKAVWPADKPIAEIVFAQTLGQAKEAESVSLWVMLTRTEIESRSLSKRYSHFLCTFASHPTALWITSLLDHQREPRWLPCYIDLKDPKGQQIARLLSEKGYYFLILFDSANPSQPVNVVNITLPKSQRQLLRDCLETAQQMPASGLLVDSKQLLKQEYQRVKSQILDKLQQPTAPAVL